MDKEERKKNMEEFLGLTVASWISFAQDQGASLPAVARAVREMADSVIEAGSQGLGDGK